MKNFYKIKYNYYKKKLLPVDNLFFKSFGIPIIFYYSIKTLQYACIKEICIFWWLILFNFTPIQFMFIVLYLMNLIVLKIISYNYRNNKNIEMTIKNL